MNSLVTENTNSTPLQTEKNLVFIDSAIEDYQSLLAVKPPNTELVILDPAKDGVQEISETLTQYNNVAAIHLVSHGQSGNIQLGNTVLNLNNIDSYSDRLQDWSSSLTEDADILIYGCNVGADHDGELLVDRLADLTEADIAASTNLTGGAALGGDWNWEINTGAIESELAFATEAIEGYEKVFSSQKMGMNMKHSMDMEHQSSLLDLVPHSQATHIAVKNGSWFDASTWENGQVPDNGANVLIPKGLRISYGKESDARLDTLRVDGSLSFLSKRNSKMLIDTFVVSPEGKLNIGRANSPIQANKTAQIIFTSDRAINKQADPTQLGKGLISHGQASIYGADKLDFVKLANDVSAGDNKLILNLPNGMTSPTGWQVGDELVLGGTSYNPRGSDEDNSRFRDEVLTITAIDGNKISFTNNDISSGNNTVLRFDHKRPEGYTNELNLYIANITRNVVFETENSDNVPVQNRGHVMFMHNPNVVVQNAGFYNLGRTDKNKLIDDPVENVDGKKGNGTNARGRYSLHFHRTGTDNLNGKAAIAKGNAIVDSPGWGIAHHDSNAILENNVVFDVVGAGIAAEAGNELGSWRNNITIKTKGDNNPEPTFGPSSPRVNRFDYGFNGEGYWMQGAGQVEMTDNVAISSALTGFMHYGGGDGGQKARDAQTIPVANLPAEWQSIAKGTADETVIDVSAVPLKQVSGFESYNSSRGMIFWASMRNPDVQLGIEGTLNPKNQAPGHNFYSNVNNFKLWGISRSGVSLRYANQIQLNEGLILGATRKSSPRGDGIIGNDRANKNIFSNLQIEGFQTGLRIPLDGDRNYGSSIIKNSKLANNTRNFGSREFSLGKPTDYPAYFQIENNTFDIPANNIKPTAKFSTQAVGGLGVNFDAGASFDSDSPEKNLASKGITSYGWDFNNDGNIDEFGREVSHYFDSVGSRKITLTVFDNQGAASQSTKTISISPKAYSNLIVDGNFDSSFGTRDFDSTTANKGWIVGSDWTKTNKISRNGGAAITKGNGNKGIGQSILDNWMRRGKQTLSVDIKNHETSINSNKNPNNQLNITVWGVNGEFRNSNWEISGPESVGAIPMQKTKLLEEKVGGASFDWTNFSWDLDFKDGYQFIMIQVNPQGVLNHRGDYMAIDNLKIQ